MKKIMYALPLIVFGTIATPAIAGTSVTTMPVTATVVENCSIAATPMAFGSLTSLGGSNIDSTSTISLVCTPNADFDVSLDDGLNASGGSRRLKNVLTTEHINYEVFIDAGRSQRWGNSLGTNTVTGAAPLGVVSYTAYGRIGSGAAVVSAGAYADVVTVTVTF